MTKHHAPVGALARAGTPRLPAPLLSIRDVAAMLSVSERTVRRMVDRRDLPSLRIGRLLRISAIEVRAYLAHAL